MYSDVENLSKSSNQNLHLLYTWYSQWTENYKYFQSKSASAVYLIPSMDWELWIFLQHFVIVPVIIQELQYKLHFCLIFLYMLMCKQQECSQGGGGHGGNNTNIGQDILVIFTKILTMTLGPAFASLLNSQNPSSGHFWLRPWNQQQQTSR